MIRLVMEMSRRPMASVAILGFVALASSNCPSGGQAGLNRGAAENWIQLDFRPFQRPESSYLKVSERKLTWVSYSSTQLTVSEVGERELSIAERTRIDSLLAAKEVDRTLRGGGDIGDGLARGDLVQLRVGGPGGSRAWDGFLADSSVALRTLVEALLDLVEPQHPSGMALAYTRSAPIDRFRLAAIRKRGMVRLIPLSSYDRELQEFLREGFRRPFDFIPADAGLLQRLEADVSHGRDLFVLDDDRGYQVSLYLVGSGRPQRPRETY